MCNAMYMHMQVDYVKGWGKITGANSVEVALSDGSKQQLSAKNILIATGSEVTPMNGVTIDEKRRVCQYMYAHHIPPDTNLIN